MSEEIKAPKPELTTAVTAAVTTAVKKSRKPKVAKDGMTYPKIVGSRDDVWAGLAYRTRGKLTREGIHLAKSGKLVSKKRYEAAKNRQGNLRQYQFVAGKTSPEGSKEAKAEKA